MAWFGGLGDSLILHRLAVDRYICYKPRHRLESNA